METKGCSKKGEREREAEQEKRGRMGKDVMWQMQSALYQHHQWSCVVPTTASMTAPKQFHGFHQTLMEDGMPATDYVIIASHAGAIAFFY